MWLFTRHFMVFTFLRSVIVSVTLNLSSDITQQSTATRPRVAVCVAGAVRSLTEEKVRSSFNSFYGDADVFYHLYVGVELSLRGQRKMVDSSAVTNALVNASGVRLQYEENRYTCGQQATGKFFNVEQCARMVFSYAALKNVTYDAFILTRPDYMIYSTSKYTMSWMLSFVEEKTKFYHNFDNEVVLLSNPDGAHLAATMTQAECCDVVSRKPDDCFMGTLIEPRPNFIFARHFLNLGSCANEKACLHPGHIGVIVRTAESELEVGDRDVFQLHGKVRPSVSPFESPGMSPPFLEWALLERGLQQHLVAHYTHKAYFNHSA